MFDGKAQRLDLLCSQHHIVVSMDFLRRRDATCNDWHATVAFHLELLNFLEDNDRVKVLGADSQFWHGCLHPLVQQADVPIIL